MINEQIHFDRARYISRLKRSGIGEQEAEVFADAFVAAVRGVKVLGNESVGQSDRRARAGAVLNAMLNWARRCQKSDG